jgi:hypothetical protein
MWRIEFNAGNDCEYLKIEIYSNWTIRRLKKFISSNFEEYQNGYSIFLVRPGLSQLVGTDKTRTRSLNDW